MTIYETMERVETQSAQLEMARAVMAAARHYFEDPENWKYLFINAGHILLLLEASDMMLYGMSPELSAIADELSQAHKKI